MVFPLAPVPVPNPHDASSETLLPPLVMDPPAFVEQFAPAAPLAKIEPLTTTSVVPLLSAPPAGALLEEKVLFATATVPPAL